MRVSHCIKCWRIIIRSSKPLDNMWEDQIRHKCKKCYEEQLHWLEMSPRFNPDRVIQERIV